MYQSSDSVLKVTTTTHPPTHHHVVGVARGSVKQSALILCDVKICVSCYSHPAGVVTVTCPDLPVTCPDLPVTCF
ncbi:hypothetical protein O3P69_014550 [Scylla paramamosain]|uniref:Uncharacterized protein n=1 Tax=Scylla paramamosain TaxID=85552 RepID=A0AAW0SEM5_SCYPA